MIFSYIIVLKDATIMSLRSTMSAFTAAAVIATSAPATIPAHAEEHVEVQVAYSANANTQKTHSNSFGALFRLMSVLSHAVRSAIIAKIIPGSLAAASPTQSQPERATKETPTKTSSKTTTAKPTQTTLKTTTSQTATSSPKPDENTASPMGPTYTQHFGERFSGAWGQSTFDWSGYTWSIRDSEGGPQAPNPTTGKRQWNQDGAKVQPNGDLVVENKGIDGGVEIILVPSTGYGEYEFTYSANFNEMHPSNVLGIFTYDFREFNRGEGFTEMDFIEVSRWNAPHLPLTHGSTTYYPDDVSESKPGAGITPDSFEIPSGYQTLTTKAKWSKGYLRVTTTTQDGKVLSDAVSTQRVPRDNAQQIHINLWTSEQKDALGYQGYRSATGDTITFHNFSYTPE